MERDVFGNLEDICPTRRDGSTNTIIFLRNWKTVEKILLNRFPIMRFSSGARHGEKQIHNLFTMLLFATIGALKGSRVCYK
jgi:hypothetical protein